MRLGATPRVAQSVAALSRRWWHNSLSGVHHVLTRLIHEADLKTKIADGILLRNQNVPARI
jgi:hypothetical protein